MTPRRILIADDDLDLAHLIGMSARTLWPDCRVSIAEDGREALQAFAVEEPDLVILDVMMPPPDGLEVCRRIRADAPAVPVLILSARNAMLDEVRALDVGADDYLTKPCDHLKLLAHLRMLARRAEIGTRRGGAGHRADFAREDLTIDFATREVHLREARLDLTPTEYVLLEELARHAGQVVPHRQLLERVWGPEYVNDAHYLKVFVSRLRQKLGDDTVRPRYIQTQWGTGYRLVPAC
jgi:DNA-binding response OmpR family regulator